MTRFYDADSGEIMIAKVMVTHMKRDSLRRCFSVVIQDTSLYSGTIMDNIRYSKNDAIKEEVIKEAEIAHAADFIDKLPIGYAAKVSAATDNVSQGQRQLISIARAVLCDSPIFT